MSTGAEKVLPLGSADRLAGELEAPEQCSLCLSPFMFRIEAEMEAGKEDELEAKGKDSVRNALSSAL